MLMEQHQFLLRTSRFAVHIAAFFANLELAEPLFDKRASVRARNGRGETPLDGVSADPCLQGGRGAEYVSTWRPAVLARRRSNAPAS